jgi:hypothetical protein
LNHITKIIMVIKIIKKKTLFENGNIVTPVLKITLGNASLFVIIAKCDIILIINVLISLSLINFRIMC